MCLGIPGQIVAFDDDNDHLASIEVAGVRRGINVGLLVDDDLQEGDWVLIHVGFAMAKIDEDEADEAMKMLRMMGEGFDDELSALTESRIE